MSVVKGMHSTNEQSQMCSPSWGCGIEAQRLQLVNIRTRDLEAYEQAILSLTGNTRLTVSDLKYMVGPAELAGAGPIRRIEKRGKWSLMAYVKKAFPTPEEFVEAAKKAGLPFVRHLERGVPDDHNEDRAAQERDWALPLGPFPRPPRGAPTGAPPVLTVVPDFAQSAPGMMAPNGAPTGAPPVLTVVPDFAQRVPDHDQEDSPFTDDSYFFDLDSQWCDGSFEGSPDWGDLNW